MSPDVTQCF